MAVLAHPQGMGFAPSELYAMTVDEILWWECKLIHLNEMIKNSSNK